MNAFLLSALSLAMTVAAAPGSAALASSDTASNTSLKSFENQYGVRYAFGATIGAALYWAYEAVDLGYVIMSDPYYDWIPEVQAWGWKIDLMYMGD